MQTLKAVNGEQVFYRTASIVSDDYQWGDWKTPVTNADLDGILYTLSDGSTGIEAGSGSTKYRLQLVTDGRLMLFKSTDGGSTWPTSKVVNSI